MGSNVLTIQVSDEVKVIEALIFQPYSVTTSSDGTGWFILEGVDFGGEVNIYVTGSIPRGPSVSSSFFNRALTAASF